MAKVIIKSGSVINRGQTITQDILVVDDRIERIDRDISHPTASVLDANEKWVIPGIIDDQVHFREPGLTYKADIHSESRAALAGGVTSFMEMPNTKPAAATQELLENKYQIAQSSSIVNYSFFMGATNENLEEVLKTDARNVCGVKVFMGSSTGNMLVDDETILDGIFSRVEMLIATHCEDEATIRKNVEKYKDFTDLNATYHPIIRSREGCYKSSSLAVGLAKKHGTRLHVLHISTKEELSLFEIGHVTDKKITAEACVHHLFFDSSFYPTLGNDIKCNPAIKDDSDRDAILQAVIDDRIDVIATDHAPHTRAEKDKPYNSAPSGLPLIQHPLILMMDHYHKGRISPEIIVKKMCHAPADLFRIEERGYLDEGMYADIVVVDPNKSQTIRNEDMLYKCGWTPLDGMTFKGSIDKVMVNGSLKYADGKVYEINSGKRLTFRN
jgi:dihydroorotase